MRVVVLGGTFNVFHRGHRALIDRAFQVGDEVVIGITSDEFASKSRGQVAGLGKREAVLRQYLEHKKKPWRVEVIDRPEGMAATDPRITDIVASEATMRNAEKINDMRRRGGLAPLSMNLVPHVLSEDYIPISSTRVLKGEIDIEGRLLRPMLIAVGSENAIKVAAVKRVMDRLFTNPIVVGRPTPSKVREQPWEEETVKGAVERAKAAITDADLGVGIEAGVWQHECGLYDIQICAVQDKMGRVTIGQGPGFLYPPGVEVLVRGGSSVGEAFRELYGWEKDGKNEGAIGFLTRGVLTRTDLTEQAVLAAMVPRIRKELYFVPSPSCSSSSSDR